MPGWNPWKAEAPTNVWFNSLGHTNQLALDLQSKRVYLASGASELQCVDVSDPSHPSLTGQFGDRQSRRGVWGLALDGSTLYLAYIRAAVPFQGTWSGVVAVRSR